MTVKSDFSVLIIGLMCLLPFLFLSYLFYRISEIMVSGILIVVSTILFCRFLVAVCRTFQFDNTGITIKLLQIKKHYPWEEVMLHQENYENQITFSKPQYKNCIFFDTVKIHKPRAMQPLLYCILIHPFSFVFVNYDLLYEAPEVYPVNEDCFMKMYYEWQGRT